MKKTVLDSINILYQYIAISELMTGPHKPNGGLYKVQRPVNSISEDVVINSLPLNHEDIQEGVLNVNIYVPNLVLELNGITDNSQPNYKRITELSAIASNVLDDVWEASADYTFNIQQDNLFEDTNNQHYINFRIEFYSPNNN